MAPILQGFPPSSMISPGPRLPSIRERKAIISQLYVESRFAIHGAEFLKLSPTGREERAVCYKGHGVHTPGLIYHFDKSTEVTCFETYFPEKEKKMLGRDLMYVLEKYSESWLEIILPDGNPIPAHFHVTEVAGVAKHFIDCGGSYRESYACVLQTWVADDKEHRLFAGKLASILKKADEVLDIGDLSMEVEYEGSTASQYILAEARPLPNLLLLILEPKHTDCLAKDKCGVSSCGGGTCCD